MPEAIVNLEEAVGMTRRREETEQADVSPVESREAVGSSEEELLDEEEDVGVLRLMRLQAAMKEKHLVESKG